MAEIDYAKLTRVQRLAVFLIVIGPEAAAEVMRHFNDVEIEAVCREMGQLPVVPDAIRTSALEEFTPIVGESLGCTLGGLDYARRALEMARARAIEWNADPSRVAVVGFSAGGNLVARLAYQPSDVPVPRPDAVILVYPAYLQAQDKSGPLREGPEGIVPNKAARPAPACFFHSSDDPYPAEGSLLLAAALRAAGTKAETHVFEDGGHGWGVRGDTRASRLWPEMAVGWLSARGLPPSR
jgi:predicted esterase